MTQIDKNTRILVTGASGFLGRHIVDALRPVSDVLTPPSVILNLMNRHRIRQYFDEFRPEVVINAAAIVGGIGANRRAPGEFLYKNAVMGLELMEVAREFDVKKFVQLGTACSYPCNPPTIPFVEEELWAGYPEPTNAPYGLTKRLLMVQAKAYRDQYGFNAINLLPTNLYGPRDHFDPETSHVIPSVIRLIHEAVTANKNTVELWGTGNATRDFLYVEDCAEAVVKAAFTYNDSAPLNLGSGHEVSIRELAHTVADLMGYQGLIVFDATKPDGQPRRVLDSSKAEKILGFKAKTSLSEGLTKTIRWYVGRP